MTLQRISERVSVNLIYNHETCEVLPKWVSWRGRQYLVVKVGLHHTFKKGDILFHVFSVAGKNIFLRLILNTSTLHWNLEEVWSGF